MEIEQIDHIELYVTDAEVMAAELAGSFGFVACGRGGSGAGPTGSTTILLRQGAIALLVTSAVDERHPAARYVRRHGDGVAVIGLQVADARAAFEEVVRRGARPVAAPRDEAAGAARVTSAEVGGFGDVRHRLVSRDPVAAPLMPGVVDELMPGKGTAGSATPAGTGLLATVDHLAVCLPAGELEPTVRYYRDVFGFDQTFEERIVVGAQAMDSKVVQSASGKVTLTLIEPDTTRAPGQIDAFVESHGGAGVQHIALGTADIAAAVRDTTRRGVRFLTTPAGYYEALPSRLGEVGVPVRTLQELSILADRDYSGVMMQIFTASRHPRRTFFWELIERRGARSFGSNNITALYEAVERRQAEDRAVR